MSEEAPPERRRLRGRFSVAGRNRRPRRRPIDLRKAMFVLPNLFTVSNIFCGFYSITLCLGSPDPAALYRAALAIFFGMFFDLADGRVARLTRTQSEFGVQLDSLADVVTFGTAPAVLLYTWSLKELGFLGVFISFLFVACGALRLARFNVMAASSPGAGDFVGLPIPLAAGNVVAMVLASYPFERPAFGGSSGVAIVVVSLSLLMVSTVRYRAFKKVKANRRTLTFVFAVVLLFAALSAQLKPAMALALLFLAYVVDGIVEAIVFFRRRRAEKSDGPDQHAPPA